LPDTPEGRLDDLIETAKAHFRAKVEHPFRVIKRQFGSLFMARHQLLCKT
jgi:IS5 family transposase